MGVPKKIIVAIIAVIMLTTTLATMVDGLVDARAVTGVQTTFQTGVDISQLVLGVAPVGVLLVLFWEDIARGFGRGKG